jgi:hypothetical protein
MAAGASGKGSQVLQDPLFRTATRSFLHHFPWSRGFFYELERFTWPGDATLHDCARAIDNAPAPEVPPSVAPVDPRCCGGP